MVDIFCSLRLLGVTTGETRVILERKTLRTDLVNLSPVALISVVLQCYVGPLLQHHDFLDEGVRSVNLEGLVRGPSQ